jgi:predicted nuclease of predicted toxin-antitoxin system
VKVLLDECLPQKLRHHLQDHDVATVGYMGWSGITNGKLLAAAEAAGFDVLLTSDKGLGYQNNLAGRPIGVVALLAVSWNIIKYHLPAMQKAVVESAPGVVKSVECGIFRRPRGRSRGLTP